MTGLDPRRCLVVVSSKSFTTAETLHNARAAIAWLRRGGVTDVAAHLAAVTANAAAARALGVPAERVFSMCDWVGGRYSVWSVAGLSIALTVGAEVLIGMRAGAEAMDQHFRLAPLASNAPAQLALAGLVNCSVLGHNSLNIAAYSARLLHLVTYLQQLEMESLGKRVAGDGQAVGVPSAPIIWGMPGTDGQHTFFQWLHQSENGAPVDFIASLQGCPDNRTRTACCWPTAWRSARPCCAARAWSRRCWTWPISTTASARCVWRGTWCIPAGVLPR